MHIHTVKTGEKVSDIARTYGVSEDILRMNNGITGINPAVGEELAVLTPTRTYTTRRGDTPERLALRFGIRRRDILAMNPWIEEEGLLPDRTLALKYDQKHYGMAAANGYYYNGCTPEELNKKLSYLTYVTVGCRAVEGGRLKRLFDGRDAVGIARSADKIPLMRVFDGDDGRGATENKELIDEIIAHATAGGYKGVTLGGRTPNEEFLLEMRKKMIGCDLILITEVTEESPPYMNEYADGSILMYRGGGNKANEIEAYRKYATECDGARTFIELPCFAKTPDGYVTVDMALTRARRGGCVINPSEDDGALSFTSKKYGRHEYPSLKKIKATLDTVHEYGFMGISFDIMRVPIAYLMMYNNCYGTSTYTSVRSREGCSRAREE